MAKRSTSKRELIDTGKDKRLVKRTANGRFKGERRCEPIALGIGAPPRSGR